MQYDEHIVRWYAPLTTQTVRRIPTIGGVYHIFNLRNRKGEVGQSGNLRERFRSRAYVGKGEKTRFMRHDKRLQRDRIAQGFEGIVFACLAYENDRFIREKIESKYIKLLRTHDSRFGYNQTCGATRNCRDLRSPESSQRRYEKVLVKKREFFYLPWLASSESPIDHAYLISVLKGRGALEEYVREGVICSKSLDLPGYSCNQCNQGVKVVKE